MISTENDEPLLKRVKRTSADMSEDTNANGSHINFPRPYHTTPIGISNPLLIAHPSPMLSLTNTATSSAVAASNVKTITSHTTHLTIMHQQHELETLQMQMEHERDKNRLELKKLQNTVDKLQQQLQLSTKELQQQNELYNETQDNYEKQIQDLTTAHRSTLQENRQLQLQIEQHQYHHISRPLRQRQRRSQDEDAAAGCIPNAKDDDNEYGDDEEDEELNEDEMIDAELHTYQVLNQRLQTQIQNYTHNEKLYQQEIQQLKQIVQDKLQLLQNDHDTKKHQQDENEKLYEEAPKTLLQELNTCRIQLATSERHVRQVERQMKYEQQQYTTMLQENEALKLQNQRFGKVQGELQELHRKYAQIEAENVAYQDFAKRVFDIMNEDSKTQRSYSSRGPPELATVLRFLENAKRHSNNASQDTTRTSEGKLKLPANDNNIDPKQQSKVLNIETMEWTKQQRDYEIDIRTLQTKYDSAHHQMVLYQREIESLKSLIQTYERQMVLMSPTKSKKPNDNMNISSTTINLNFEHDKLMVEYSTMKELCEHLKQGNNALVSELNTCQKELNTKQSDYDQLRIKYQQIKDAMEVEKERRQAIEQQLIVAEQLAGKGSFDHERTRILHITETPLIQALKEEITVLKRQIDTLLQQKLTTGTVSSPSDAALLDTPILLSTSSTSTMPNPEKVIQRLKEQFKEQIGMFREGVYAMTGYKIDMITNNPSTNTGTGTDDSKPRLTFRLRSVFAEHEEDQLLLQWNTIGSSKSNDSNNNTNNKSLDILQTDFAKQLSTTSCYEYIAKLHSIPAFLASTQLMLFEKQTIMM